MRGAEGETLRLRLRLGGPGGGLRGWVLGPDGEPLAGAAVRVTGRRPPDAHESDGTLLRGTPSRETVTAPGGEFEVLGLAPGPAKLEVRAPHSAPYSAAVEIVAGARTQHTVRLETAGVVFGTVRDGGGAPVEGAEVRFERIGHFLASEATSDAGGGFRLEHLPAGRVELVAEHPERGKAHASLDLAGGVPARWDPVLQEGRVLAGRVVDEAGQPWVGWRVRGFGDRILEPEGGRWYQRTHTDAGGRFQFVGCPADPLRIEVEADERSPLPVAVRQEVEAGGPELVIVVPAAELPSATLRGAVVGPDGGPAAATVSARLGDQWPPYRAETDPATGAFELEGLRPGRFWIAVDARELPAQHFPAATLAPEEVLDLGPLQLHPPGRLEVTVAGGRDTFAPFERITIVAVTDGGAEPARLFPRKIGEEALDGVALAPGDYSLEATGPETALDVRRVTIRTGETSRVDLAPRTGTPCVFRVPHPGEGDPPTIVTFALESRDGGRMTSWWLARPDAGEREYATRIRLVEGTYRMTASTQTGLRESLEFSVAAGDGERDFELELGGGF